MLAAQHAGGSYLSREARAWTGVLMQLLVGRSDISKRCDAGFTIAIGPSWWLCMLVVSGLGSVTCTVAALSPDQVLPVFL